MVRFTADMPQKSFSAYNDSFRPSARANLCGVEPHCDRNKKNMEKVNCRRTTVRPVMRL